MASHNQAAAKSRLGLVLLEKGLISQQQLDTALKQQAKTDKRLGEILVDWEMVSERQLRRALKKQSRYRLVAAFVAMMLGPVSFGAFASSTSTQAVNESRSELAVNDYKGLTSLDDSALASVSGQGQNLPQGLTNAFNGLIDESQGVSDDDNNLGVVDNIATVLNPLSQMIDADVSVKGVKYHSSKPRQTINDDGSIDMSLPSEIEEIAFRNIRVKGSEEHSGFGDIIISGVRFSEQSNIRIQIRE